MTLESVVAQARRKLEHGPVDIASLVESQFPFDMQVVSLLEKGFHVGVFSGRIVIRGFECDGHISAIADDTRPVWH